MSLSFRRAYHVIVAAIEEGKTLMYGDKKVILNYDEGEEDLYYYNEEYNMLIFIFFCDYAQICLDNGLYQITGKEHTA